MPDALTPAHLRALIAAATPGPWKVGEFFYPTYTVATMHSDTRSVRVNTDFGSKEKPYQNAKANADLIAYLVNNAPALADALEAKKLLDALMGYVLSVRRGNTNEWMEGLVETLNATEMAIGGKDRCEYRRSDGVIRVRRAAKEAHDGNI